MAMRSVVPVLLAMLGCGGPRPQPAPPPRVDPSVAEVIGLEADRTAGVDRLGALAGAGATAVRVHAIQALGRLGDEAAAARLMGLVGDPDAEVRRAAIWALGVAGAGAAAHEAALVERYGQVTSAGDRAALAWTLGRLGTATSLPPLIAAVQDADAEVRVAGGHALGMLGRRSIPLDEGARRALASATGHVDARVRQAAAFALSREFLPPADADVVAALARLARDGDPEVRAAAVIGLGKREGAAPSLLVDALADKDWRVRLEAVRGLALPRFGAEQRQALAAHLAREWALSITEGMRTPRMHVVLDGLRGLMASGTEKVVAEMAAGMESSAAERLAAQPSPAEALGAGTVHCLAVAIRVRAGAEIDELLKCGGPAEGGFPAHARRALAAEVAAAAGAGLDPAGYRRKSIDTHVQVLTMDSDPRVRAAAIGALVALGKDAADQDPLERRLRAAIGDRSIEVSGTAADAIAELAAAATDDAVKQRLAPLVALVVERAAAGVDGDIEVRLTYLGALAKAKAGREVCVRAHGDPVGPVRRGARDCLKAIDGADPGPGTPRAAAPPPPYVPDGNVSPVLWRLMTTKGTIDIELDPARAPWHVAALVGLTRSGVYDGRLWHRVAAGFVVQGGSPQDSAWGGPDFIIPGEPTPGEYRHGTVGIADSGMDTGGSQFFIMHARAPHLDGRYTIVGKVVSGQLIADSLLVGDQILRADVVE